MEITLVGIIVIILSIIAFFKDEDLLLGITVFFSTFTAAISLNIQITTTIIISYIIPMGLWMFRQLLNFFQNRKNFTIENVKKVIKNNKVFTAILFFTMSLIISNVWLFVSKISYTVYDAINNNEDVITFSLLSVKRTIGFLPYLIFAMMVSLKVKEKEKIKKLLKIFAISSICAVCWGLIQYALYYLNIDYPHFLFNNNPGYAQWYHQVMHGIKRINSIATEPSTFALNLLAALPIILISYIYKEYSGRVISKILNILIVVAVIVCTILTTSSTALIGLIVIYSILMIYLLVKYIKSTKLLEYKRRILKLIGCTLLSIVVSLILMIVGIKLNDMKNNEIQNEQITESNIQNEQITESNLENSTQSMEFINAIEEMTISKLSSDSGKERVNREKIGFEIFLRSPIFGVAYGSFRTFTLFTNVLVNLGILGLVSILYLLYMALRQIILNRKKDEKYFLVFLLSIIGMLVAFSISIPDLIYVYFWLILVLGYNYFLADEKNISTNKEELNIGIDGRSLTQNRTGVGTYTYELLKKLNSIDSKNTYYIYYNKEIYIDFKLNENFKLSKINARRGFWAIYFKLPKLLKRDNIDIFWGPQHILPRRNSFSKNIKFILTVHDLAIHKFKNVGEWKNILIQSLFLKKSCKNANVIITVSKATKQDIIEVFKIKEDKINVVYSGTSFNKEYKVNKDQERMILNKFNIEDKNYLFFVSTIEPRKNIVTLIKAFEILKEKEENETLKLILSGGLGWKYHDVLDAIEKSKYKEDINLTGYISKDEKEYLFKNAKCFVYPSLYEGFGLPILEAMARETIVVTSNISSIPEVGGEAAFYLNDVHSENELANLIEKVFKLDEESKKVIIEKGYKQVEKFTWEKCAKETASILIEKNNQQY